MTKLSELNMEEKIIIKSSRKEQVEYIVYSVIVLVSIIVCFFTLYKRYSIGESITEIIYGFDFMMVISFHKIVGKRISHNVSFIFIVEIAFAIMMIWLADKISGIILLYLFGICIIMIFLYLTMCLYYWQNNSDHVMIEIGQEGIINKTRLTKKTTLIKWKDINKITMPDMGTEPNIYVYMKKEKKAVENENLFCRMFNFKKRYCVSTSFIGIEADNLFEFLQGKMKMYTD